MKQGLFLDDMRVPNITPNEIEKWHVVTSYDEFVEWIKNNPLPYVVSFDHDLADEHVEDFHKKYSAGSDQLDYDSYTEKTGYDCAKFLLEYCQTKNVKLPLITVHSMNVVGVKNIQELLQPHIREKIFKVSWQ